MFLARLLARPAAARRIAARLPSCPRPFHTAPPVDPEILQMAQTEKESESDPAVRSELDSYINATPPPALEESSEPEEEDFDFPSTSDSEPPHATILEPAAMARTAKELFGSYEGDRSTLQTLPGNFDVRSLPLPGPLPETYSEIEFAATVVHGRSIHRPFQHPRTHGLPAAQIQFRSHNILAMNLFVHFATHAAYSLGIPCTRMYSLPTQRQLWTVTRGPFAHKKAQENFERKVHRRGLKAFDTDPGVVDLWFKYLRRHAMGGVGMRCVMWERLPMGAGQKADIQVLDTLNRKKQLTTSKSKIKSVADKIVQREMGALDTAPSDNIKTVVDEK